MIFSILWRLINCRIIIIVTHFAIIIYASYLQNTTLQASCLKTGPAGAYKLCHRWLKILTKIVALAMITQHGQTYASHVDFDSFTAFMRLFRSYKLKGSLHPKLKPMFGPLIHAVKLLQAESVISDHCTGTVKGKLIKVNCSDIQGNFYVPRLGRFLGLTHLVGQQYGLLPVFAFSTVCCAVLCRCVFSTDPSQRQRPLGLPGR